MLEVLVSREGQPGENFTRVSIIDGPGNYRFATDPNRVMDELIPGQRPLWEEQMFKALKKSGIPYTALSSQESSTMPNWRIEGGYFNFNGQMCQLLLSSGCDDKRSIGHLTLIDMELVDGREVTEFGSLSLTLTGTNPNYQGRKILAWRGWLSIDGEPNGLIKRTISGLNAAIQKGKVPLWKQD